MPEVRGEVRQNSRLNGEPRGATEEEGGSPDRRVVTPTEDRSAADFHGQRAATDDGGPSPLPGSPPTVQSQARVTTASCAGVQGYGRRGGGVSRDGMAGRSDRPVSSDGGPGLATCDGHWQGEVRRMSRLEGDP